MIARPKISRNERKTTEIGAFEVGNFAPFSCPGLLTAAPLAAAAACWLERPRRLLPRCAIIALAAFVPFGALELRRRSSAATAGSWGDLTTAAGLWRHASRAEYGTFRLGAGRGAEGDAWRRAGAYLEWTAAQQGGSRVGLLLAALGAGAGLALERRVAAAVVGAWAFYVAAWHGVWSNLPIFGGNAMAYEVHARFWMQPHALLCCAAGAGAAAVLALVDGALANTLALLGPKPAGTAVRGVALAVASIVALGRVETLYPAHDFGRDGLAMKAHGLAVLNGLPARSLLLSHSDLHWNPSRYLRTCERRRPDVEHVSLQLLPYPWFARQKRAYGNVSWPDVPPRPSTDVAADAYEVMLSDAIAANLGGFPGGVYVDLHGVYEPRIGSLGRWRGFALVPWGVNFRAVPEAAVAADFLPWVDAALAQIDALRATWAPLGGPQAAARFRRGTWEHAARSAYNDAHYQLGLFCLTAAQELRRGLEAPRFPSYLRLLRNACVLISQAADDAGALSSPERDVVKNAALAAVSLHGALAAGSGLAGRAPFGDGDLGPPDAGELAVVAVDASARAAAFLGAHGAGDPDAAVFEDFLRKVAPRPGA